MSPDIRPRCLETSVLNVKNSHTVARSKEFARKDGPPLPEMERVRPGLAKELDPTPSIWETKPELADGLSEPNYHAVSKSLGVKTCAC